VVKLLWLAIINIEDKRAREGAARPPAALAARRAAAVDLGIPAYRDIAAATLSIPGDHP